MKLLRKTPEIAYGKPRLSMETWKKLKPLTIDEIIQNSEQTVDFFDYGTEFKEQLTQNAYKIGQFKRGTNDLDGIGRRIFIDGQFDTQIQEGQFVNGKLQGYARIFNQSGAYYIGMYKNNKRNGQGRFVYETGQIEEGMYKDGELIGSVYAKPATALISNNFEIGNM